MISQSVEISVLESFLLENSWLQHMFIYDVGDNFVAA